MNVVAVVQDIEVEQGATFRLTVEVLDEGGVNPRDLTGFTGSMQIRESAESTTVLATATVGIDEDAGLVTAQIGAAATDAYDWRVGVYDLEITDGTETLRLARGNARLTRQVTR